MSDGLPLGFITRDKARAKDAWTQQDQLIPGCLAGTRFERDEMYFGVGPNTTLDCAIVPEARFGKIVEQIGGCYLREKLQKINIALPDPKYIARLERAVLYRLLNPGPDIDQRLEQQLVMLVSEILDNAFTSDALIPSRRNRWEIQRAVIDFTTQLEPGTAPTVKDLSACVRSSEDTLIRACKEKFGLKPLDLMRFICLEQARLMLKVPEIRQQKGLKRIGDVHKHFGWQKGDKFAALYAKHYGVLPSADFVKA